MDQSTIQLIKQTMDKLNAEIEAIQNVKAVLTSLLVMDQEDELGTQEVKHWTQLPENRRKMLKVVRCAQHARLNA